MSLMEIRNLVKRFDGTQAVADISLDVSPGKVTGLLGPSGCGKTTALRCIAGLEDPTSGEINIAGKSVYSSTAMVSVPPEKRGIGLVFQSYALWPHLTVRKNVAYGLEVARRPKSEIVERTRNILSSVELDGFEDRHIGTLSGGQQQRVALARSLVMNPEVLLFDEPLSNLDAKLRVTMRRELRELVTRIGLTAVYVTHDQEEAMVLADRIALMNEGNIEQEAPARELYEFPKTRYAAEFLGSANMIDADISYAEGDKVELKLHDGPALTADLRGRSVPDVDWIVAIRPEKAAIRRSEDGVGATNAFRAEVNSVEFLGRHTVYQLRHNSLLFRVESGTSTYEVGDTVTVDVAPENVLLVEA